MKELKRICDVCGDSVIETDFKVFSHIRPRSITIKDYEPEITQVRDGQTQLDMCDDCYKKYVDNLPIECYGGIFSWKDELKEDWTVQE